jgi:nitrogen regulatory protein P-II 1
VACHAEEAFVKRIQAIIKPFKLDEVREALDKVGVRGMTVWEVRGFGRQGGHTERYRGAEYEVEFVPKLCVDVVVEDDKAGEVASAITDAARTGQVGDGKVFMSTIDDVMRIRTGETGPAAV